MPKEKPAIVGSVLQSGRLYKAGDEDALAKVLPSADVARLVKSGQLSGDWGASSAGDTSDEGEAGDDNGEGEEQEALPKLADLPAHLQTLTTVEEVEQMRDSDDRKGAVAHYEARLDELTEG